jgi:hypothetical protein
MGRLHKLTQGRVIAAKTPGLYSDGGNLHLRVAVGGSRQWVFRYTLNHRTRDYGVGPYPTLSLAEAPGLRAAAGVSSSVSLTGLSQPFLAASLNQVGAFADLPPAPQTSFEWS